MLMDEHTINYRIRMALPEGLKVVDELNPSERMKAIKNADRVTKYKNRTLKRRCGCNQIYVLVKDTCRKRIYH